MRGKRSETHSVEYVGRMTLVGMFMEGKGTSKHSDKQHNREDGLGAVPDPDKIYLDGTLHDYEKAWHDYCQSMKAANFKVNGHKPRTLEEAALYMPSYIEEMKLRPGKRPGSTYSAWTIRAYFSGCAKVMGLSAKDYNLPERRRQDITRSRGEAVRDHKFSQEKNADLIEFCRCTGLRNASELQKIKGDCLRVNADGEYMIHVVGKGKKARDAKIIGTPEQIGKVVDRIQNAGDNLVWPHVNSKIDVHDLRADYAQAYYKSIAREGKDVPLEERYCCRGDLKGHWYDKVALLEVSKALGHERENVIVSHYLRGI